MAAPSGAQGLAAKAVEKAVQLLTQGTGVQVALGSVGAGPGGIELGALSASGPGWRLSVPRARLGLDAGALAAGRVVFERLELVRAELELLETTAPARGSPPGPAWWHSNLAVRSLSVQDGLVLAARLPGGAARRVSVEGRLEKGAWRLDAFSAAVGSAAFTAKGEGAVHPPAGRLEFASRGDPALRGELSAGPDGRRLRAEGTWAGTPLKAEARLQDERWSLEASASGLPLAALSGLLHRGRLDARLEAEGRLPWTREARARLRLSEPGGAQAEALARLRDSRADWSVQLSSAGLAGRGTGSWTLEERRLEADWELEVSSRALLRWDADLASLRGRGKASGRWPELAVDASAELSGLRVPAASVARARLEVSGRLHERARAELELTGLRARGAELEQARLRLRGSRQAHRAELDLRLPEEGSLELRGRGSLADGRWTTRWERARAEELRGWEPEPGFGVSLSSRGWAVEGLKLRADGGAAELGAEQRDGRFRRLSLRLEDVPSSALAAWGLWPASAAARVSLSFDGSGPPGALRGPFSAVLGELAVEESYLGRMEAAGRLEAPALVLDRARWQPPDGDVRFEGEARLERGAATFARAALKAESLDLALVSALPVRPLAGRRLQGRLWLEARGSGRWPAAEGALSGRIEDAAIDRVPLGRAALKAAAASGSLAIESLDWTVPQGSGSVTGVLPLDGEGRTELRLRAGGELGAWLELAFPALRTEDGRGSADLLLIRERGAFRAEGGARLSARRLGIPSLDASFAPAELSLEGKGDRVTARLSAGGEKGPRLRAEGVVGRTGPDLRLEGRELELRSGPHLAQGDADLRLAGRWEEPALSGSVRLSRARYSVGTDVLDPDPGAPAEPEAPPSKLDADIRVLWERNGWIRDGVWEIETRGDLRVLKAPGESAALLGSAESVRGRYEYLGRGFDIRSARVDFEGNRPPNPKVRGEAVYSEPTSGTRIFLDVSGPARDLELKLRSEPPLEEQDILSVLVVGRPHSDTERSSDRVARERLNALLSEYLTRGLRASALSRLDLDVFRVRLGGGGADVTVGRYLTDDLYVSLGQTLGSGSLRRIIAEYTLSPHWSIEGRNSSDGKYILDFLFRYGLRD